MIYVMSDIHGCYEKYIEMLKLINFNDNDTLYIIGDICDRGNNPMKILFHMMEHENIIPIFGNHDLEAYPFLVSEFNDDLNVLDKKYLWWMSQGGKTTITDFQKLNKKEQDKVLFYIEDFRDYIEIKVNGKDYLLVHGGLKDFESTKPLSDYRLRDLVWERPDYNKVYFNDKYIISGHTPTHFIDSNMMGKIIIKNNHICIDCGCVYGNTLACLCLDTMEEFYIDKQ